MDWLIAMLVLAVLVLPLALAWVILSWNTWRKPEENGGNTPAYTKHGKFS